MKLNPENDDLLPCIVVCLGTSAYLVSLTFLSLSKTFQKKLVNNSDIIPVSYLDSEVAAELREEFPNIETIKVIYTRLPFPILLKVSEWAEKLLDAPDDELEEDPRSDYFISDYNHCFHELLDATHYLEIPEMVALLSEYADRHGILYNLRATDN